VSHVADEITSQPDSWRTAVKLAKAGGLPLPADGARVAVVGCGTSLYVAQAYAALRESGGFGETDAFAASEMPRGRRYDHVLALSRSGTTTEVLELLDGLRGAVPTTGVTADPATPLPGLADETIVLDFADERSVVQTRFATATLTLLRATLGSAGLRAATASIEDAETALLRPLAPELLTARQYAFLGRGWTIGLANEAALKMREASLSWTESYPAMEYRHGPISIAAPDTVTWMLGTPPEGLAAQVAATGAWWVQDPDTCLDPLAELILVQRVAIAVGTAHGLDPDQPRHLTRSVILGTRP
jgi:fructoselysine-6-P-deglycase FrlB-like protein